MTTFRMYCDRCSIVTAFELTTTDRLVTCSICGHGRVTPARAIRIPRTSWLEMSQPPGDR